MPSRRITWHDEVEHVAAESLRPFSGGAAEPENPFALHEELQTVMQSLVGIVRLEDEMREALTRLLPDGREPHYIGREEAASPATG